MCNETYSSMIPASYTVTQDGVPFFDTVRDELRKEHPHAPLTQIIAAARAVCVAAHKPLNIDDVVIIHYDTSIADQEMPQHMRPLKGVVTGELKLCDLGVR